MEKMKRLLQKISLSKRTDRGVELWNDKTGTCNKKLWRAYGIR